MNKILVISNGENDLKLNELTDENSLIDVIYSWNLNSDIELKNLAFEYNKLIITGGIQTTTKLDEYPYLYKVMNLLNIFIFLEKPILGLCLGCQMIAKYFDSEIVRNDTPTIGFNNVMKINYNGITDNFVRRILDINPNDYFTLHFDHIKSISNDFNIYLKSDKNYPYFFKHNCLPIYGIQFHPEINYHTLTKFINMKVKYLDNKTIKNISDEGFDKDMDYIRNFTIGYFIRN